MKKIFNDARRNEQGFTLLELLLVVGISSVIFLGIAAITQSFVNTEIATSSGQYLQRVATVSEKFIEANWTVLPTTGTDDAITAAQTDPKWAGLVTSLTEEGLMQNGQLRNPIGSKMIITYKVDTVNSIYRIAVYTETPLPVKKVQEAARQAGNYGGTVTQFFGTNHVVGAFGQYDVPLTALANTIACTATAQTACLFAVSSHNNSTLSGSFLYRNDMGDPKYNTMTTDLIMNNKSVTGAAAVNTTDLNVSNAANLGTTTVNGTSTFNGPTTIGAGLVANGGMDVSGNANFANDVTMTNGIINVDTLNSSTIQSPEIRTNTFNAQNLAVNGGNVTVDDDINVNGNISANGEVFANTVNAGVVNANGGAMTVGAMEVKNTMTINGAVNVNAGVVTDRMVADHCTKVHVGVDDDHPDGYAYYGVCP